jgi:hypothetical protein
MFAEIPDEPEHLKFCQLLWRRVKGTLYNTVWGSTNAA